MGNIIRVRGENGRTYELDEERGTVQADGYRAELRELSTSDVHIASAMSNFVAGYGTNQGEAIADIVMPPLVVLKDNDYYHAWDKDDLLQDTTDNDVVGEEDEIPVISPRKSTGTYACVGRGLASRIPQGVVANADPRVDPRTRALGRIINVMCMRREKRSISVLQNASTFSGYTSAVAAAWNGGAGSDPVADIMLGIETALKPITHIAMSEKAAHAFVRNPNVAKNYLYNSPTVDVVTGTASVASRLGLPQFVIGKMKGKSVTAGTYGYLWGTGVSLLHIPPGADANPEEVPTARTFRWNKTGQIGSNGFRFRSWFEPNKGQDGGEMIAVLSNDIEKIVAACTGYLLTGAYSG